MHSAADSTSGVSTTPQGSGGSPFGSRHGATPCNRVWVICWSEVQLRSCLPCPDGVSGLVGIPADLCSRGGLQWMHQCAAVNMLFGRVACRQAVIDGLFRQSKSSGRLKLQSKKPVVLVLGTGWGAHSLVKVTQGPGSSGWVLATMSGPGKPQPAAAECAQWYVSGPATPVASSMAYGSNHMFQVGRSHNSCCSCSCVSLCRSLTLMPLRLWWSPPATTLCSRLCCPAQLLGQWSSGQSAAEGGGQHTLAWHSRPAETLGASVASSGRPQFTLMASGEVRRGSA